MPYKKIFALLMFLTLFSASVPSNATTSAPTNFLNLGLRDGNVTQKTIADAIADAKEVFKTNSGQTVVIDFPAGTFDLSKGTAGSATIDVSRIDPGPGGWLVFRGTGMSRTTLIFNRNFCWILGVNAHRIAFINMHMTCDKPTVSQGHVVFVGKGKVGLDIQPGFPTPAEIYDPNFQHGRWLRAYTKSATNPLMIHDPVIPINRQVEWNTFTRLSETRWQLNLSKPTEVVPYKVGDLIGIKSKHLGNTYFFAHSSNIVFDHILWTKKSRGVFRLGTRNVTISNCRVQRSAPINGQTPCLATPDGGPQIGQPGDEPTGGHRVENCDFQSTGDDSVAFYKSAGTIANNRIRDSFGRGILLYLAPNVQLINNDVKRCPVMNML